MEEDDASPLSVGREGAQLRVGRDNVRNPRGVEVALGLAEDAKVAEAYLLGEGRSGGRRLPGNLRGVGEEPQCISCVGDEERPAQEIEREGIARRTAVQVEHGDKVEVEGGVVDENGEGRDEADEQELVSGGERSKRAGEGHGEHVQAGCGGHGVQAERRAAE